MIKSKRFAGVYQNKMKNGDVSYYFTYRDTNDMDSKGIAKFKRIKVGTKANGVTEAFTNQKRIETINALKLGEDSPIKYAKKKQFTFQNGFDDYMIWAKSNKKTWKRDYDLYSLHLIPLHYKELVKLTKKDFEKIRNEKLKTHAPRTVEYILAVARQIINHCIDDELVKNYQNPIRKVHGQGKGLMPKYDNQKLAYLSYDQAKAILKVLGDTHPQAYQFSVLMLFTGARFDEIANLTWQSIDFDSDLIHIEPSKGGLARKVLITQPIADVLQTLLDTKTSQQSPLIPNSQGKRWERIPKQWQTTIDKLYPDNKEAGKYRITPHTLRHTHASWLAKNGTDILRIKEQLGHKKLDMTLRYAHLIPNQRHDKTQELFDNFAGGER
jgi:integrase